MNLHNLKKYSAFFGSTLSYVSGLFYWDAISARYSNPQNVSDAYAAWLYLGATIAWVVYIFAYAMQAVRSKKS